MDAMVGEPEPDRLIAQEYSARQSHQQNHQPRAAFPNGLLHGAVISYDYRSFRKTNFKLEKAWSSPYVGGPSAGRHILNETAKLPCAT
jgi:hypothetical protein